MCTYIHIYIDTRIHIYIFTYTMGISMHIYFTKSNSSGRNPPICLFAIWRRTWSPHLQWVGKGPPDLGNPMEKHRKTHGNPMEKHENPMEKHGNPMEKQVF